MVLKYFVKKNGTKVLCEKIVLKYFVKNGTKVLCENE